MPVWDSPANKTMTFYRTSGLGWAVEWWGNPPGHCLSSSGRIDFVLTLPSRDSIRVSPIVSYVFLIGSVSYEDTLERPGCSKKVDGSKILRSQGREIVGNVYKFMKIEAELDVQTESKKVQERVSKATGGFYCICLANNLWRWKNCWTGW